MRIRLRAITTCFIVLSLSNLPAQQFLFDVQDINIKDGLPDREIYDIVQDKQGYIWVSTVGAIGRYDGNGFKKYFAKELGVSEDMWCSLAVDEKNNVWFCERRSVRPSNFSGVINTQTDSIYSLEDYTNGILNSNDILNFNYSNYDNEQWFITTGNGTIYQYGSPLKEIHRVKNPDKFGFISCEPDSLGNYWILNGSQIKYKHLNQIDSITTLSASVAKEIIQFSPSLIFESFSGLNGTKYWELKNGSLTPYSPIKSLTDRAWALQIGKPYDSYIAKGLFFVRDTKGNIVFKYEHPGENEFDRRVYVNSKLTDRQNILWIGTDNGLLKVSQKKNPFKVYQTRNSIRGIYREDNKLWIGGYMRNILHDLSGHSSDYNFTSNLDVSRKRIPPTCFLRDHKNRMWAGTYGGFLLEFKDGQDFPIEHTLAHRAYFVIHQNSISKKLWLGTNFGLFYYDENQKDAIPIKLSEKSDEITVRFIHQNEKGIWIVSNQGIFLMDAEKETLIKHYTFDNGLPFENLNHLHEDKNGAFWLATKGSGLIKWDIEKNTFEQFTTAQGLSNDVLYAVYEDDYENLWLPSNYGLMRFDKNSFEVKLYLPEDGIAHEEFNTFAHFKAKDGTLYFGGLNGVTEFHPKDIQASQSDQSPLYVTQLKVLENNEDGFRDITHEFVQQKHIQLNPSDQVLELDLALLNYNSQNANQYAYKIEGHQENWIYTSDNKISILNLPYGEYTLQLKARGETDWNYTELSFPLTVRTPFYLQWWFIGLMIAMVFGVIKWRIWQLEQDRQRLESEVKKRTHKIEQDKELISQQAKELRALDKAKTRFFSNITHEFRTPLTLIIGPLQQIISDKSTPSVLYKRLSGTVKNAQHLLKLINQLLDLSKIEGGQMKVELVRGDIIAYTQDLIQQIQPLANKKSQKMTFSSNQKVWKTHFDKKKWDKIIYNLLSNAIKFTPEGGSIEVSLLKAEKGKSESIQLEVRDTGIGIEKNKLEHIFDRFYQIDNSSTRVYDGTGIGLSLVKEIIELQGGQVSVISKVNQGTTFKIYLPILKPESASEPVQEIIPEEIRPSALEIPKAFVDKTPKPQQATPGKQLDLLIIEDNEEMREYLRNCINQSKYKIHESRDGEEGIQKALEIIPDVIISDVMMPKKSGYEVVGTIRENLSTSHIPVILLTAKTALQSRLQGFRKGADAYMTKPFSPAELEMRIEKLIELRAILRNRYRNFKPLEENDSYQKEDKFVTELREYILLNIEELDLNGNVIGKQFNLSRTQLYRKLKALTGQSISEFVKSVRLKKAYELILERELSISEIAWQAGFASLSYFSKSFKKEYGKSPSEMQH